MPPWNVLPDQKSQPRRRKPWRCSDGPLPALQEIRRGALSQVARGITSRWRWPPARREKHVRRCLVKPHRMFNDVHGNKTGYSSWRTPSPEHTSITPICRVWAPTTDHSSPLLLRKSYGDPLTLQSSVFQGFSSHASQRGQAHLQVSLDRRRSLRRADRPAPAIAR